jgi:hypothetical protein
MFEGNYDGEVENANIIVTHGAYSFGGKVAGLNHWHFTSILQVVTNFRS